MPRIPSTARWTAAVLGAAAILLGGAGRSAAAAAGCAGGHVRPTTENIAAVEAATLCLVNQQRTNHGLRQLVENPALQAAAEAHTRQMVGRNYFNHVSPSGESPLGRAVASGYATNGEIRDVGENIAAGSGSMATPAAALASWMASPPHRAEILDPAFRDTGIGVVAGVPASLGMGRSGATYVEDFGTRR
jgi:uncharacterized protein YkwD